MLFKYYFLKVESRSYDKSELLTFLKAQKYATYNEEGMIKKVYYNDTCLDFKATFVIANRSNIPHIEKLSGKYLDTNFYVEFELLSNTYKVSRLVDIIKEICEQFDFYVYNELFEEPVKFNRDILLNVLKFGKNGYKKYCEKNNNDEFLHYDRMDEEDLEKVYSYIEVKDELAKKYELEALSYKFYKKESSRKAFTCIDLTEIVKGVIIPPGVYMFRIKQKDERIIFVRFEAIYKKISKFLTEVPSGTKYRAYLLNDKYFKKVKKILLGTKFNSIDILSIDIYEVELSNIYDL